MKKMVLLSLAVLTAGFVGGCHKTHETTKEIGPAKVTVTSDDKDEVKSVKVEMKEQKATGENGTAVKAAADTKISPQSGANTVKSDQDIEKKAAEWVKALNLGDAEKEARVAAVIATHLKAVRDWHNEHPYTTVPAGINPITGIPLNNVDREVIADSAMPKSVHEALMGGLKKDLTPEQVEAILDKYTIGKVAFTMKGYRAIVPDLTDKEAATIEGYLKEARERAVDFKSMKAISAIFEIYKTKSEQYLNANGRNWKEMYSAFTAKIKAEKAAKQAKPADGNTTAK
jgi:hypothetical protein